VPALGEALLDPKSGIQQEAAVALWRISRDTNVVLPKLTLMITNSSVRVQRQAIAALARIERELRSEPCQAAQ
jgi:hypothetical protein